MHFSLLYYYYLFICYLKKLKFKYMCMSTILGNMETMKLTRHYSQITHTLPFSYEVIVSESFPLAQII